MIRVLLAAAVLLCSSFQAMAADIWKVENDIARLRSEVPSIAAFEGAHGIVWHRSFEYTTLADGTRSKKARVILQLEDNAPLEARRFVIPFPTGDGADVRINMAAIYSIQTGWQKADLEHKVSDDDGIRSIVVTIPNDTRDNVVAISFTELSPMTFYLEDVVELADELPIWEQTVDAVVPAGMDIYWEGNGVRDPVRETQKNGVEHIKWTLKNQHAESSAGVVANRPPMLIFSLQRGLISSLRGMANIEGSFKAPAMPKEVASAGKTASKAGSAIHSYLKKRMMPKDSSPRIARDIRTLSDEAKWTSWECTLTAAKWLEQLGISTTVYWNQRTPISSMGPNATAIWDGPVLKISPGSGMDDIFYTAAQGADFGKLDHGLYGAALYRFSDGDIDRLVVPKGSASEHSLIQNWKMTLSEDGSATGKLDLTATGAWISVLGLNEAEMTPESAVEALERTLTIQLPGLSLEAKQIKVLSNGIRVTMDVRAQLGIVSGGDILMRIPGGMPNAFREIPANNEPFNFCFPFVLEQNAVITTPPKFKALMLPPKVQSSSSRSQMTSNMQHWPKRRAVEAEYSWIVRNTTIDDTSAKSISEQAGMAFSWSTSPIPLRK